MLATFALGTAAGDLTALSLNLGFFPSVVLFASVIAIPAIGWWRFNMNPIVAFWFAYIVTSPLGASFADWFSKPTNGGLGLGDGTVSASGARRLPRASSPTWRSPSATFRANRTSRTSHHSQTLGWFST